MQRLLRGVLSLLTAAVFMTVSVSGVFVQGQDLVRTLLTNQDFQQQFAKDLEITDAQVPQLQKVGEEVRSRLETLIRENAPLLASPEDRQEALSRLREEGAKITNDVRQTLNGVLNEKQLNLYHERTFQMSGGLQSILINPAFGTTLDLSEEQLKKVAEIQKKLTEEVFALMDKLRDASPEERTAIMRQLQAFGEKASKMVEAILDDKQKAKVQRLHEEMPDYIWKALPANRNKERPWRPAPDSWKPGEGVPENVTVPREERPAPKTDGRRFPGT
ncbi:MAG: hypothetical protein LBQ54_07845 [Planctomycetaceae bacterium]|nr:hypothetical protein [Planctomycetaceae bacterium]